MIISVDLNLVPGTSSRMMRLGEMILLLWLIGDFLVVTAIRLATGDSLFLEGDLLRLLGEV